MGAKRHPRRRQLALFALLFLSCEVAAGVALASLLALDRMPPTQFRLSEGQRQRIEQLLAGELSYLRHDPGLGWSLRPGGGRGDYRANSQGFRADREHPFRVPQGRLRIGAFGDSFTHGDEVAFADTWGEQLAALSPGLEVLNFGVPAYGPGQALLRYEAEAERFELPIVTLGVMTTNIERVVNRFRPFLVRQDGMPMGKPRFVHEGGQLRLLENPLASLDDYAALLADEARWIPRLGQGDYFYQRRFATDLPPWPFSLRMLGVGWHVLMERGGPGRPIAGGQYNEDSQAFAVLLAVCERFREQALRRGSVPVFVLLPPRRDMREMRRTGRARHAPLVERLREQGARVIDVARAFADRPGEVGEGVTAVQHYNAAGNAVVAGAVRDALVAEGLLAPAASNAAASAASR